MINEFKKIVKAIEFSKKYKIIGYEYGIMLISNYDGKIIENDDFIIEDQRDGKTYGIIPDIAEESVQYLENIILPLIKGDLAPYLVIKAKSLRKGNIDVEKARILAFSKDYMNQKNKKFCPDILGSDKELSTAAKIWAVKQRLDLSSHKKIIKETILRYPLISHPSFSFKEKLILAGAYQYRYALPYAEFERMKKGLIFHDKKLPQLEKEALNEYSTYMGELGLLI